MALQGMRDAASDVGRPLLIVFSVCDVLLSLKDMAGELTSSPRFWTLASVAIVSVGAAGVVASYFQKVSKRWPKIKRHSLGFIVLALVSSCVVKFGATDSKAPEALAHLQQLRIEVAALKSAVDRNDASLRARVEALSKSSDIATSLATALKPWNQTAYLDGISEVIQDVRVVNSEIGNGTAADAGKRTEEVPVNEPQLARDEGVDPAALPVKNELANNATSVEPDDWVRVFDTADEAEALSPGVYEVTLPSREGGYFRMPPPATLKDTPLFFRPSSTTYSGPMFSPVPTLMLYGQINSDGSGNFMAAPNTTGLAKQPFLVSWCLASESTPTCEEPAHFESNTIIINYVE